MKKGYNIHSDANGLIDHLGRVNPPFVLVLDNYGLAHDIAVKYPHMQVIYRPYYPASDAYHLIMSPFDFVMRQKAKWQGEPNIWFHTGNESGLSEKQLQWEMDVVKIAPVTMKFVVGNPATGTFPDSVDGWKYADKYIRFLVENKDRVILGLHEYFDIIPCITMPDFQNRIKSWDGETRPAWHTNRYRWLIDYCDTYLEGKYPNIVLTEFGNDDLRENRPDSPVNKLIDATPVTSPYHNIRAFKSLRIFWEATYSKPFDEVYYEMIEWCEKNVYNHPAILGMCIFAWCENTSEWDAFNVAYANNFRQRMEKQKMVEKVMNLVASGNFRFRDTPSLKGATIKVYPQGIYQVSVVESAVVPADGFHWQRMAIDGVYGYVATEVITLIDIVEPTTVSIDKYVLDDAKKMVQDAMEELDGIKTDLNAVLVKLQTAI